jgi:hypothetical protein
MADKPDGKPTTWTWPAAAAVLILLVYAISFGLLLFIDHVPPPGRQGIGFRPAGTYIIRGWQGFVTFFYLGYMIPVTGAAGAMWSAAWLANPLLWYGVRSMLRGRNGRTLTGSRGSGYWLFGRVSRLTSVTHSMCRRPRTGLGWPPCFFWRSPAESSPFSNRSHACIGPANTRCTQYPDHDE